MNNLVTPMIRALNTFGDAKFEKINWPNKVLYGTFCVYVYDENIIQEIFGINGYAFRTRKSDVWGEWIEILKSE